MLKVKKWRRIAHDSGISCELGRLKYSELPLVFAMNGEIFEAMSELRDAEGKAKPGVTMREIAAALRQAFERVDVELIERLFMHRVRNVEGLETEDGPVTSGMELLEVADQSILTWILGELIVGSQLSDSEGKASDSPSTSASVPTNDSDSPAESTGSAGGPSPSTAPATETDDASSSRVA